MRILILAATPFEIQPLQKYLAKGYKALGEADYFGGGIRIDLKVSGVGLVQTAFAMAELLKRPVYDLAINLGLAGAYNQSLSLGDVVSVVKERYGDLGAETAEGDFLDLFDLGLADPNEAPYKEGWLENPTSKQFEFLTRVKSLSVNQVHGKEDRIKIIKEKYSPDIENMEGAAFFSACLSAGLSFLEIRSISNYVEARNKDNWEMEKAINALNKVAIELLESLQEN